MFELDWECVSTFNDIKLSVTDVFRISIREVGQNKFRNYVFNVFSEEVLLSFC